MREVEYIKYSYLVCSIISPNKFYTKFMMNKNMS